MPTRRDFLRLSALATAAGCALRFPAFAVTPGYTYGVQLYMVRDLASKDLAAVLKAIHAIGFSQIELYPIAYNRPATELRSLIADSGLGAVSGHFNYDTDFEQKIDYAHQLGLQYMVCPMLPGRQWTSLAGFREAAAQFNTWAAKVKSAGLTFAFHNHCYEFKPMEGGTGFAEIMRLTDPALVKLEMDCYWITQAGLDPLTFLRQHKDRIKLLHMKDRHRNAPTGYVLDKTAEHFIELGQGTIHWKQILEQGKQQGIRYAFVDQDATAGPVLESLKTSYSFLQTLGV